MISCKLQQSYYLYVCIVNQGLGERVYRIIQWKAKSKDHEPGNFHDISRSLSFNRAMEPGV